MALRKEHVLHDCPVYTTTPPDLIPAGHVSMPYLMADGTLRAKSATGESVLPMADYQYFEDLALNKTMTTTATWEVAYSFTLNAATAISDYFLAWNYEASHTVSNGRQRMRTVLTGANAMTLQGDDGQPYDIECPPVANHPVVLSFMLGMNLANLGGAVVNVEMMNLDVGTLTITNGTMLLFQNQQWN